MTRRAGLIALLALGALGVAIWLARSAAPVAAPRVVLAPNAFEVSGELVDGEGAPVEGAEVLLFADRATWVGRLDLGGHRPSDEGRDCEAWPQSCHSDAARAEVQRRLDAGTLAFPEPLAKTLTGFDGRFSLATPTADAFVVAFKGNQLDLSEQQLSPWRKVELAFSREFQLQLTPWTTALQIVNPFTGQAKRFEADQRDQVDVPLKGGQLWQDTRGAPTQRVEVQLEYDGGAVEGTIELDCGPEASRTLHTDGGIAAVELTASPHHCTVLASTPELFADTILFPTVPVGLVKLQPRSALSVRWAPGGVAEVVADFPVEPDSIAGKGTRGGGHTPGHGFFDGGVAIFDPLHLRSLPAALEVVVRQPGFVVRRVPLVVTPGMNELSVALERAPGTTGFVVDAQGYAVPGVRIGCSLRDGGARAWAETDARGAFAVDAVGTEPLHFSTRHPLLGAAEASSDPEDETFLVLQPTSDVTLLVLQADGGPLARGRVAITVQEERFWVKTGASGEVRLPGLQRGPVVIEVEGESLLLEVPRKGAVQQTVQLR